MNSCPRCKASIFPDDNFCGTCGYEVNYDLQIPVVTKKDIKIDDVRLNLGTVYFKMRKYDQAKEIFLEMIKTDPENKIAQNMLDHIKDLEVDESTKFIMKE